MKLRYLLIAVAALVLQASASEGKRWWSHIEFLADDALEGRNVGSAAFEKAATYVEGQFKEIGLRPGGVSGYRQPVKFESRVLVPEQSKLALLRSGVEEPLTPREDAVTERTRRAGWLGRSAHGLRRIRLVDSGGEVGRARRAGSARENRRLREHDRSGGRVGQREVARQLRRRAMGGAEEGRCDRGCDVSQPSSACRHDFGCCSRGLGARWCATSPTDSRSRGSRASGAGGAGRVHHGDAQGRRKAPRGQRPHDRRAGATDCRQEAASTLSHWWARFASRRP